MFAREFEAQFWGSPRPVVIWNSYLANGLLYGIASAFKHLILSLIMSHMMQENI